MNRKYLFWSITATFIVIAFLGLSRMPPAPMEPQAKEVLDSCISADDAGRIILTEYPNAAIKEISLEQDNEHYYYQVSLVKDTQEYSVTMDILSGAILGESETIHRTDYDRILNVSSIEKLAKEASSTGTLTKISLEEEDGYFHYHVELLADNKIKLIHYDCIRGNLLLQQTLGNKEHLEIPLLSWDEAKQIAHTKVPAAILVTLELDDNDEGPNQYIYVATLIDQNMKHELEIDATTGAVVSYEQENFDAKEYPTTIFN